MTTRLEQYMDQLLSGDLESDSGFLGAYNMGVFGLSVSGKARLREGLVGAGVVLTSKPGWTDESEDNPPAENYVAWYDTPRIWGYGDGEEQDQDWSEISGTADVQEQVDQVGAWRALVGRWKAVIAQSRQLVDITSLSPPVTTHEVEVGICEGIAACLQQWITSATSNPDTAPRLMIRLMFGMSATKIPWKGTNSWWNEFKQQLEKTLRPLAEKIRATDVDPAKYPIVLYGSDMGRKIATFNHSKIVAGDGQYALVGGHNMCEEVSSKTVPIIHDITAEVTGPGARSANAFAQSLWIKAAESGRLWINKFNWTSETFKDLSHSSTSLWAPKNYYHYHLGAQSEVPAVIGNQHWYYPMASLPAVAEHDPPAGSVPATAVMGIGRWGNTEVFGVNGEGGLKIGAGVPATHACQYASDTLKRFMINDIANTVIAMAQQDLVNAGTFGSMQKDEHTICELLGERLRATPKGTAIKIVVSSRYTQNCEGLAYSYGDGPREAAERISDTLVGVPQASAKFKAWPQRLQVLELSTQAGSAVPPSISTSTDPSFCTIAPLTFCQARGASRDRGSYVWKDAKLASDRLYTNGRFWNKADADAKSFGPGNHSKVLYVSEGDDNSTGLVMIGSDNMYPSPLSEFSFVIEGEEAIESFRERYWDPLWGYSARLGFTVKPDGVIE